MSFYLTSPDFIFILYVGNSLPHNVWDKLASGWGVDTWLKVCPGWMVCAPRTDCVFEKALADNACPAILLYHWLLVLCSTRLHATELHSLRTTSILYHADVSPRDAVCSFEILLTVATCELMHCLSLIFFITYSFWNGTETLHSIPCSELWHVTCQQQAVSSWLRYSHLHLLPRCWSALW